MGEEVVQAQNTGGADSQTDTTDVPYRLSEMSADMARQIYPRSGGDAQGDASAPASQEEPVQPGEGEGVEASGEGEPESVETLKKRLADTQAWGHEASRRAKELERQLAEMRAAIEAQEAQRQASAPQTPTKEERAARLRQALEAIDELDPDDPDYTVRRAEILAEAMDYPVVDVAVEEKVRQVLEAERAKAEAVDRERRMIEQAEDMARKAGLNMSHDSPDFRLFWDALNRAPMGDGVTLKQQVEYMINEVKSIKQAIGKEVLTSLQGATQNQIDNAVLTRGATPRDFSGRGARETQMPSISQLMVEVLQKHKL